MSKVANAGADPEHIVVWPSSMYLLNLGDAAMLQVAVARLKSRWPNATVYVLTNSPRMLSVYCPTAQPLPAAGITTWSTSRYLPRRISAILPQPVTRALLRWGHRFRQRQPILSAVVLRARLKLGGASADDMNAVLSTIANADMFVAAGGGFVNDSFKQPTLPFFDLLELALRRGIPTAMFSQGIGPLSDPQLRRRTRDTLPLVDLIALREGQAGPHILEALGVAPERIFVSGDDAIELSYPHRTTGVGAEIGINLRVSRYSGARVGHAMRLRSILLPLAERYGAGFVPVPISTNPADSDVNVIRDILVGQVDETQAQQPSLAELLAQIGRCRVMITGSYHAGVFALAQGIPVIGLTNSKYYDAKFQGLATQFPGGCQVAHLDDPQLEAQLESALAMAWQTAADVRPLLLAAAQRQIQSSQEAYSLFAAKIADPASHV